MTRALLAFLLPFLALLVLPWYVGSYRCRQGYGSSRTIAVCEYWRGFNHEWVVYTWQAGTQTWEPYLGRMSEWMGLWPR